MTKNELPLSRNPIPLLPNSKKYTNFANIFKSTPMKLNLRTKCNNLLQRFIRLFSLSGIAFVVTACYGTPYAEYEVQGQVYGEQDEPLEAMQVIVRTYDKHDWPDTLHTNAAGYYHVKHGATSFGGDCIEVVVHDPNGLYESDSVHISSNQMKQEAESNWSAAYTMRADIQLKKK
ncbi:MAG: radical SAM-associated putative lipoprotein [Bacteroidaceae bacterium]|nr:radical SAM-associated putative lipoprotein [Bacteroidaceae bacterium]